MNSTKPNDDIAYEENAQTERIIEAFAHLGSSDDEDITPDDESESEMTPAELLDCIMNETDLYMVDYHGDACEVLMAQPQFLVLRQTTYTSLVLFPDGTYGIFITDDVVTAR